MSFRFLPDVPASAVRMPVGQTVLLDPARQAGGSCIEVLEGMARVYCPCEETELAQPCCILLCTVLFSDFLDIRPWTPRRLTLLNIRR